MSEILKPLTQTDTDPLLEISEFYSRFVKAHIENSESEVGVISFPQDLKVDKEDFVTVPLSAEEISRLPNFEETAILNENLYLFLHRLVRERFLIPQTTKLIPQVGLTQFGFIMGTAVKEKTQGPIAFFVRMPAFVSSSISKSTFEGV